MGLSRAQSAMEYLMTYGWAILIIAIVLAALFQLGIFSSAPSLGSSCIASTGYLCSDPVLHNGNFVIDLGQATGIGWTSTNVIFVESGSGTPTSSSFATAAATPGCMYVPTGGSFTPAAKTAPIRAEGVSFSGLPPGYSTSISTTTIVQSSTTTISAPNSGVSSGSSGPVALNYGMTGSGASTCTALPTTVGSVVAGAIWVEYSTSSANNLIVELGTLSVKAT